MQVTEDGSPWLDMSHVTSCLNKLDCGVDERLMLVSRDSQNALVVTYTDLKMCMDNTFSELSMSSMAAAAAAANLVTNPAANTTITNPSHDPTSAMVCFTSSFVTPLSPHFDDYLTLFFVDKKRPLVIISIELWRCSPTLCVRDFVCQRSLRWVTVNCNLL